MHASNVVWAALSTLGVTLAGGLTIASASESTSCTPVEYASLPVTYSSAGYPEVPVTINGKQVQMLVNTASASSVIDVNAYKALGLVATRMPNTVIYVGNERVDKYTTVPSLKLGNLGLRGAQFIIEPMTKEVGPDAVGSLGTNVLVSKQVDLEIDLSHNRINLLVPDRCPSAPIYWADHYSEVPLRVGILGNYYIVMELNGKKVEAGLAISGAQSMLVSNVSKRLYGFDEHSREDTPVHTADGKVSYFRAMELTSGGLSVMNANIELLPPVGCAVGDPLSKDQDGAEAFSPQCFGAFPLSLGMSVLRNLRLYLSPRDQLMYFTAAGATIEGVAAAPAPSH